MEIVKIKGVVSTGKALGRKIGYPTANIYGVENIQAADGVYAVSAKVEGISGILYGMANLGHRPTVEQSGKGRALEVHFFDYQGDLYGRSIEISLCKYLRGEQAFDAVEELRAQISRDEVAVREYFENNINTI